jgi:hypothetical protein
VRLSVVIKKEEEAKRKKNEELAGEGREIPISMSKKCQLAFLFLHEPAVNRIHTQTQTHKHNTQTQRDQQAPQWQLAGSLMHVQVPHLSVFM